MSTEILLVRHGETDWNRVKRIQGHLDIGLSAAGREQAQRLAVHLSERVQRGMRIDAMYSSDLARARETAQPLADALGQTVVPTSALRERMYGAFEGYDPEQIRVLFPIEYAAWQTRDPQFAPAGGESQQAFYDRVTTALVGLAQRHSGQRIVAVAHGGVLDCAYRYANRVTLGAPRTHALLNASVNVLDFDADGARVIRWADIEHLETSADDGFGDRVDSRVV
jgi:2,3-bisphosphoglycerate-dependent phosphoglycerate mutase